MRAAQLAQGEGLGEDNGPESLFSLAKVKGKAAGTLDNASAPDFDAVPLSSSSGGEGEEVSSEAMDTEDEQRK